MGIWLGKYYMCHSWPPAHVVTERNVCWVAC